jgi:hypothetical protein
VGRRPGAPRRPSGRAPAGGGRAARRRLPARQAQAAALPVPDRRHAASGLHRARAPRRRDGSRQDGAGGGGLRASPRAARRRPRARRVSRVAQGRVGGPDHQVHRPAAPARAGHEACPARLLRGPRLLHHCQLRAGDARCRRRQPAAPARGGDSRRGAADQELEHPDGAHDQAAREPLRVPPHRDADREPHRRGSTRSSTT